MTKIDAFKIQAKYILVKILWLSYYKERINKISKN